MKHSLSTYSIVGYDPIAREWGVAVQGKFLAVGAVVQWARAEVGAVATQSYFGPATTMVRLQASMIHARA